MHDDCLFRLFYLRLGVRKGDARAGIRGIRLTCDDALISAGGLTASEMLKLLWHLKGQLFTMLRISWTFPPLLRLGCSEMKDMQDKLNAKTAPLLGLLGV